MKKFCLIVNTAVELRPHLSRKITYLCNNGWSGDVFCVGGEGKLPDIDPKGTHSKNLNIIVTSPLDKNFKPGRIIETIRQISTIVKYRNKDWDIVFACHPYSLLVAYFSKVYKIGELIYAPPELNTRLKEQIIEKFVKNKIRGLINNQIDRERILKAWLKIDVPSVIIPNTTYDYYPSLIETTNLKKWGSPLVLLYQGTSNVERRMLDVLIDVVGKIEEGVILRIAVGGQEKNIKKIKELIERSKFKNNFIFDEFVSYPNHFRNSVNAHVGIMLYNETVSLNYKYCAPNKLYEYPMLGLPVISSDQGHLKDIIESNNFGLCIDPKNPNQLLSAINKFKDVDYLKELSSNARLYFMNNGKYNVHGEKLINWIDHNFTK